MFPEHPYYTQLINCYHSRRIPQSFSDRGNTYLCYLSMTSVEKKLKQVRAASTQLHIFLYLMHFATLRIERLAQFLKPTVRVILGVLCLHDPTLLLLGHPEVCVSPETRHQRKYFFFPGAPRETGRCGEEVRYQSSRLSWARVVIMTSGESSD